MEDFPIENPRICYVFGATRRIRTDDLLITNKPPDHNRTHSEAKLPAKSAFLDRPFSV